MFKPNKHSSQIVSLWQYANAPKFQSLLAKMDNLDNPLDKFFNEIYNIDTATLAGLSIWANILKLNFFTEIAPSKVFGFGKFNTNFNHGNFGASGVSVTIIEYRRMIKARFMKLVSNGNLEDIVRALQLFDLTVSDNLNATLTITPKRPTGEYFGFNNNQNFNNGNFAPELFLTTRQKELISNYDIIPKSAGITQYYKE